MKKLAMRFGNIFAGLALLVAVTSANSTCMYFVHQPELPEEVKALRKF